MRKIEWIQNLDRFQFVKNYYSDEHNCIKIYKRKYDYPIMLITYFFRIEDKIADMEEIHLKLNQYQKIRSKFIAKIDYAAVINMGVDRQLVLIHETINAEGVFNHQFSFANIMENVSNILKGLNRLHIGGIIHHNITKFNLFWNGNHALLGLPMFLSIKSNSKSNKIPQKPNCQNEQQRKDIVNFADVFLKLVEGPLSNSLQKQIYRHQLFELSRLITSIRQNQMEICQIFKQIRSLQKKIQRTTIEFQLFDKPQKVIEKDNAQVQSHKKIIEGHFQLQLDYYSSGINIKITSKRLPSFNFCTFINQNNFLHPQINSVTQLYHNIVSKHCQTFITKDGRLVFKIGESNEEQQKMPIVETHSQPTYLKVRFNDSHLNEKSKQMRRNIEKQIGLEDQIEKLINYLEETYRTASINTLELRMEMKIYLTYLLSQMKCNKVSNSFRKAMLSRLQALSKNQIL